MATTPAPLDLTEEPLVRSISLGGEEQPDVGYQAAWIALGISFLLAAVTATVIKVKMDRPAVVPFVLAFIGIFAVWMLFSIRSLPANQMGYITRWGRPARDADPGLTLVVLFIESLKTMLMTRIPVPLPRAGIITAQKVRPLDIVDPEGNIKQVPTEVRSIVAGLDGILYVSFGRDRKNKRQLLVNGTEDLFSDNPAVVADALLPLIGVQTLSFLRDTAGALDYREIVNQRGKLGTMVVTRLIKAEGNTYDLIGAADAVDMEVAHVELPEEVKRELAEAEAALSQARATITTAEAEKQATIRKAEAEKEKRLREAEGDRDARIKRAEGFAAEIRLVSEAAGIQGDRSLVLVQDILKEAVKAGTLNLFGMDLGDVARSLLGGRLPPGLRP